MIMQSEKSFGGLVHNLVAQVKTFIREEVQLAKAEMSEKISQYGKNAVSIAAGGFVAYAGFIILLGGLGALIAFGLQRFGMDALPAIASGCAIVALLTLGAGAWLVLRGIGAIKKLSPAPEKTIETLQHLKGTETAPEIHPGPETEKKSRDSDDLECAVLTTENDMANTLEDLTDRVTFKHAREHAKEELRRHPYRWGFLAMGTGLCSSYLLKKKLSSRS